MDQSKENFKLLGFLGILKESFEKIFSCKKVFVQIAFIQILPLTIFSFLAHMEIPNHVYWEFGNNSFSFNASDKREATAMEWLYYWLFKIAYFTLLTVFSLLKVWKRRFYTFIVIYVTLFFYKVMGGIGVLIFKSKFGYSLIGSVTILLILILYVYGFLYLSVVWQLASVVAILEDVNGFKAMKRGKDLAKGKKHVGMGIALVLYLFLAGASLVYFFLEEYGHQIFKWTLVWRVIIGILCGLILLMWLLLFIVTQTIYYMVCKLYHWEAIDDLSLSRFLGAYIGDQEVYPKPGEEIQIGRPRRPSQHV